MLFNVTTNLSYELPEPSNFAITLISSTDVECILFISKLCLGNKSIKELTLVSGHIAVIVALLSILRSKTINKAKVKQNARAP